MSTVTESDIKEIKDLIGAYHKEVNNRFDKVFEELTSLKVGQAEIKGEISAVKVDLNNIKENVKDLTTTSKSVVAEVGDLKGAKSLIVPIVVAVITSLLTLLIRAIPNP